MHAESCSVTSIVTVTKELQLRIDEADRKHDSTTSAAHFQIKMILMVHNQILTV